MHFELALNNLEVSYENFSALRCQSLNVTGEILAIIGHNGAGKSTLIKSILDLLSPRHGVIRVSDLEGRRLAPEHDMAFCPETGSVFEDISVKNYVQLWCRVKCGDPNYYQKEGRRFIELLHLDPLLNKLGRELSKGQRRRVQTAIGFLSNPKLFLFDEPFDGLDVQKTSELADIIKSESAQMGCIISSHRMDVVERLADKVIVLRNGEVAASGSVSEVSEVLCRQCIIISQIQKFDELLDGIRKEFHACAVNRLGQTISVAGSELKLDALTALVQKIDQNGAQLAFTAPTLTDAMNFHLKGLS